MPEAVAVNRAEKLILLDTDETVKMETLFDAFGCETDDGHEAVTAVAPLPDGRWMALDLTKFDAVETQ